MGMPLGLLSASPLLPTPLLVSSERRMGGATFPSSEHPAARTEENLVATSPAPS